MKMRWLLLVLSMLCLAACGEEPCDPQTSTRCEKGTVYWLDCSGNRTGTVTTCPYGCLLDGSGCAGCSPESCESLGVECGRVADGCGGTLECGGCDPDASCNLATNRCECTHLSCQESCCAENQVCTSQGCCTPACEDSNCGLDGCGGSCGDCTDGERCSGAGLCIPLGWEDVTVETVRAPDEYRVEIIFDSAPAASVAGDPAAYALTSGAGTLEVESVQFDPDIGQVTLSTSRQKLGIDYTLAIGTKPIVHEAVFPSADTAALWVVDFSDPDFGQYQVTTERAGVGEHCVVYVEKGKPADSILSAMGDFDEKIFPTLTGLLVAAPDFDGNGKILLLGLDGGEYYGGYFSGVNAYSDEETMRNWGIHSNEMEIVHLNVEVGPDYMGTTTSHEFGHLLYHEYHGFTWPYWDYHDEGLAECAVHAVYGTNQYAVEFFMADYQGLIGAGLSMVNWNWGFYENYALAYLFWTYLASRADGVASYADIFRLSDGDPQEVNSWIHDNLGSDFPTAQMESLLAAWVQNQEGEYGFGDMLSFSPAMAPGVPDGTSSVDLEPFAGTFFFPQENEVSYPGSQGENIVYAAIDSAGKVDLEEPFDVNGGALLVFNRSMNTSAYPPEHSGPDISSHRSKTARRVQSPSEIPPRWLNPPPFHPDRLETMRKWRRSVLENR